MGEEDGSWERTEKQMGEEDERKMEGEDGREAYGRGSDSLLLEEKRHSAWREAQSHMEREEVAKKWEF